MPARPTTRTRISPPTRSIYPRFVSTTTRLYQRFAAYPRLSIFPLVLNHLIPVLQGALKIGFQFICAQVLPRVTAAATALIDPSRPRSQQRDFIFVILPFAPRPTSNQILVSQDSLAAHDSPEPPSLPPHQSPPGFLPPTSVAPYAVTVGLLDNRDLVVYFHRALRPPCALTTTNGPSSTI